VPFFAPPNNEMDKSAKRCKTRDASFALQKLLAMKKAGIFKMCLLFHIITNHPTGNVWADELDFESHRNAKYDLTCANNKNGRAEATLDLEDLL